jgi:hypothetical protein
MKAVTCPGSRFVGSWGFILGLPPIEADDGTPESNPQVLREFDPRKPGRVVPFNSNIFPVKLLR